MNNPNDLTTAALVATAPENGDAPRDPLLLQDPLRVENVRPAGGTHDKSPIRLDLGLLVGQNFTEVK